MTQTASRPTSSRALSIAWFASGAIVSSTMLVLWPFPAELQIGLLFCVFAVLTLLKVAYRKPARPLAFLIGSVIPYVVVQIWLGSLAREPDIVRPDGLSPAASAAEEAGK